MHIIYLATVDSALNKLYDRYFKQWGPSIAIIGIAIGCILWMMAGASNNSGAAAVGIRIAGTCIIAVAVLFGAVDLINIGKNLGI